MIKMAPVNMPLLPRPAIARPMMSMVLFRAAPHTTLPDSKSKIPDRKTGLVGKKVYMRPYSKMKPAAVSIYELPYHPISPMLLNSFVIAGIAGPMMVLSSATRKIEMYKDTMMTAVFAADGYTGVGGVSSCLSLSEVVTGLSGSSLAECDFWRWLFVLLRLSVDFGRLIAESAMSLWNLMLLGRDRDKLERFDVRYEFIISGT
jgi:hypothetical protein